MDYNITDGKREGTISYPDSMPKAQVDADLQKTGITRVKSWEEWATEKVMPEGMISTPNALARTAAGTAMIAGAKVADWWHDSSTLEKAIMLGTMPIGGGGALAAKLGLGTVGKTALKFALGSAEGERLMTMGGRAAMGAVRAARATTFGGGEALREQAMGQENAPSLARGMLEGTTAGLVNEGFVGPLANLLSRTFGKQVAHAFTDPKETVQFAAKFMPEIMQAGTTAKARLQALFDGAMFTSAEQSIEKAKAFAINNFKGAIHSPALGQMLESADLYTIKRDMTAGGTLAGKSLPDIPRDLYDLPTVFDAWKKLAGFARDQEGAYRTGKSAAWFADRLHAADTEIKQIMDSVGQAGQEAYATWRAGRGQYALKNEIGRLFRESGTLSFADIQKTLFERYKPGTAARDLLEGAYNDALSTFHRGASPLQSGFDMDGSIRAWFSMRGHVGMSTPGFPSLGTAAGAPGHQAAASLGGAAMRAAGTAGTEDVYPQEIPSFIPSSLKAK